MNNSSSKKGGASYVTAVCLIAALGGLLFGYDTAVINGAIGFLETHFRLSAAMKGWATSSALLGCVIGVSFAGMFSDWMGRKKTLLLAALLFLVSSIGTAVPQALWQLIVFRIMAGVGVGIASMASPMYIAEISPARIRGRLVSVNQFAIVTGMLVIYFVNYFVGGHGVTLNEITARRLLAKVPSGVLADAQARDVVRRQVVRQIESCRHLSDPKAVDAFSRHLDAQLQAANVDRARLAGLLSERLGTPPESWNPVAAGEAVARRLSEFGLQMASEDASLVAAQWSRKLKNSDPELSALAGWYMARLLERESLQRNLPGPLACDQIANSLIGDLEGLGARTWNVRWGWRWMFGSGILPSALFLVLLLFAPESPRWLIKQGHTRQASEILRRVDGSQYAEAETKSIQGALAHESGSLGQLLQPGLRRVLLIGVALAILQQVTGINVFLYFGTEIFKKLGAQVNVALLQTVVVGAVNLGFTIVAIWTVDMIGRKPLMIVGAAGMGLCLLAMGLAAQFQTTAAWVLAFVLGYIACFALSVGPVTWVILSEIFPTKIRGRAMSVATFCLWSANFVVSQTFPMMDESPLLLEKFHRAFPFYLYGALCVVLVLVMVLAVPETKGKSLEEIERFWTEPT